MFRPGSIYYNMHVLLDCWALEAWSIRVVAPRPRYCQLYRTGDIPGKVGGSMIIMESICFSEGEG